MTLWFVVYRQEGASDERASAPMPREEALAYAARVARLPGCLWVRIERLAD